MTSTPSSHKSSYTIVLYSSVISTSLPRVITTQGSWPKQKKSHFFFAGKTSDLSPVCALVFPSGSHIRKNTIVKGAVWTFTTLKSPYLGFLATCQLKKNTHTHTNHPQYSTCHVMFSEPFFSKKKPSWVFLSPFVIEANIHPQHSTKFPTKKPNKIQHENGRGGEKETATKSSLKQQNLIDWRFENN